MEIIKMIDTPEEKTGLVCGPAIPLTFTVNEGVINMSYDSTKKPLDFYNDPENFAMDVRHEVDVTVKDFMFKHNMSDYATAMRMVLDADEDLKIRYARS